MSSNTKNTMNAEIMDADDSITYDDLDKKLKAVSDSQKSRFNSLINKEGEELLEDVANRKLKSNEKKVPHIRYILKHSDEYNEELLMSFDLDEVIRIYFDIKELNTPMWKKILRFISNS